MDRPARGRDLQGRSRANHRRRLENEEPVSCDDSNSSGLRLTAMAAKRQSQGRQQGRGVHLIRALWKFNGLRHRLEHREPPPAKEDISHANPSPALINRSGRLRQFPFCFDDGLDSIGFTLAPLVGVSIQLDS
ncbi:hypothetical protein E4U55_001444 [Claviceps digitariae]|nr:hypothetical protein E4U55_001444 [Claviceps digitariae]